MQFLKTHTAVVVLCCVLAVALVGGLAYALSAAPASPVSEAEPSASAADEVAPEITDAPDETPEEIDPALLASASPDAANPSGQPVADASKKYLVRVYIGSQSVCVYALNDAGTAYDKLVKTMTCSTGIGNATPRGTFKLQGKYRWHSLVGSVYGQYCSRITGSILFHSVPYKVNKNPASMNEVSYSKLGRKASHGCIRLLCGDALWIYNNVASGSTVEIVNGSGPRGSKPALASGAQYRGWDPTDPDPSNPYHGYVEPTPVPTPAPTEKPTATPVPTEKPTPTPTEKPTPVPTATPTEKPTPSPTDTPSPSPSQTAGEDAA